MDATAHQTESEKKGINIKVLACFLSNKPVQMMISPKGNNKLRT
jgi:hypothetical protein